MGRPSTGGHVRTFPRHNTAYRLISVEIDGIRRQRFEHRLVAEAALGRRLRRNEVVHHIDGNGLNNSIDNLEVIDQRTHQRIHLMTGPHKWSIDAAVALRNEGLTLRSIADRFGVSQSSIRSGFLRRGISTRDARWKNAILRVEDVAALLRRGLTHRQIAAEFGSSATSVGRFIREHSISAAG
ncbi:HNH endonuclease [Aromatoleum anaerobium]|uniref:HNH nuclease domain-containing protein n=1 Tax=Aromatoleum anaerobium TaxID=182180 RepID=A0ABX1PNS8_9RHOO